MVRFMALATSLATPGSAMSPRVRKPWSMVRKGSMVIPTPCTGHMSGERPLPSGWPHPDPRASHCRSPSWWGGSAGGLRPGGGRVRSEGDLGHYGRLVLPQVRHHGGGGGGGAHLQYNSPLSKPPTYPGHHPRLGGESQGDVGAPAHTWTPQWSPAPTY